MKLKDSEGSLWEWGELCHALGFPHTEGPRISGINFDSRKIQPGDLFVALPGDPGPRFNVSSRTDRDGHDFVDDAIARGSVAVLVHKPLERNHPSLRVKSTIDGLWSLARYRRNQLQGPVIAVTGSSGKTTLKSFLSQAIPAFSTEGSFNNYIGLPLSIAVTPRDAAAAVYEIGTNHEGEIAPLSKLALPHVAVVLNVLPVHIGLFPSMEALTQEKFSIYQGLGQGGTIVYSEELLAGQYVPKHISSATFGFTQRATLRAKHLSGNRYSISNDENHVEVDVPGGGRHRARTMAATATVLHVLNRPLTNLNEIATKSLPRGRGDIHEVNGVLVIDESYNANPTSMKAALRSLLDLPVKGRRIAVLGQMNELGIDAAKYHAELVELTENVDVVLCVGELMHHLYENLGPEQNGLFFGRAEQNLLKQLIVLVHPGDAVLVKGSNSVFWATGFVKQLVAAIEGK